MEQLPQEEMLKALAFLKSRLRADNPANQAELAQRHAEMDAGKKVRWEDLKRRPWQGRSHAKTPRQTKVEKF